MKHVKMFESWLGINEARKFPENPRYEEDEPVPGWDNMKDALEEIEPDSEFKDVFEIVMKDSGCKPVDIRFEGVLKGDHDFVGGVEVETPSGFPGAVSVDKFKLGDETLYVLGAYDGDLVFSC
jgi:hypothetical protein